MYDVNNSDLKDTDLASLNELPIDKRHIKVPQLLFYTHVDNKKKTGLRKCSFQVCFTTRPQWSPFKNKACY